MKNPVATVKDSVIFCTGLLIIAWHIWQNQYTWMAERTSTCNPHRERETLQVYLYMPHYHHLVCSYLNQHLPHHWIRCMTEEDQALLCWPQRLPDLTLCKFFVWGYVKDSVFLPPLPQDVPKLWRQIIAAISEIDCDMMQWVWVETDYQLHMCHVTKSRNIDHIWGK